jgi:hypothetical protein
MLTEKQDLNSAEELLLHALNKVNDSFLQFTYSRVVIGFQRPERAFNAELYHQLRKFQDESLDSTNFRIHQEIFKHPINFHLDLQKTSGQIIDIPCIGDYVPTRISPDIVFHNSPNDLLNQLLVAEIKMKGCSTRKLVKDLQKLLFYKLSYLKFKNAVLIYSGTMEDLENKFQDLDDDFLRCLIDHKIVIATRSNKKWGFFEFSNNN